MFDFFSILPRIFSMGKELYDLVTSNITEEQYNQVLDDFSTLLSSIPALQSFLILIQPLFVLAKAAYPFIFSIKAAPENAPAIVLQAREAINRQVTAGDMANVKRALRFCHDLSMRLVAQQKAHAERIPSMNLDLNEIDWVQVFVDLHDGKKA